MRFSLLIASAFAAVAVAQNCGPSYGNQKCAAGKCCKSCPWIFLQVIIVRTFAKPFPRAHRQSIWLGTFPPCFFSFSASSPSPAEQRTNRAQCDVGAAYCDPATCLSKYSGTGSKCAATASDPYASTVPNIDVCGHAQGGVSCPGAGIDKYFYRCCSSHGHCGPKNNVSFFPLSSPISLAQPPLTHNPYRPHLTDPAFPSPNRSKTKPSTAAPAAKPASATAPPTARNHTTRPLPSRQPARVIRAAPSRTPSVRPGSAAPGAISAAPGRISVVRPIGARSLGAGVIELVVGVLWSTERRKIEGK